MRVALTMSRAYYTPIDYWLNLKVDELGEWVQVAAQLTKEETAKIKH